jgi:superfamily II DNA/RNA helicase
MADKFLLAGLKANYIVSNSSNRDEIRRQFQNKQINYLFVVDIFNEGIDIPEIDTVLFLRPTESLTIFLQQLGRGLRLSEGKEVLTILDFVANSRPEYDFEGKFRALVGKTNSSISKEIENDFPHLPLGCSIILEKKAKEIILNNIKNATTFNKNIIIKKIQDFKHQTSLVLTLKNFIAVYNIPLQKIYNNYTWSKLKVLAGELTNYKELNEKRILSAIKNKWLSTNSYSYFSFILKLAKSNFAINISTLSEEEKAMCLMLHYDVWGEAKANSTLEKSIQKIGENKVLNEEILELIDILINKIDFIESKIELSYSQPLRLHSRYTREQILAAFRLSSFEKKSSNREGVAENKELNTELLFIDLVKSENDFSPTTLYNDYAISNTIFHWQTQNATSSKRGKGLSYINHLRTNKKILLFVREQKKDKFGNTMGYVFISEGKIISYEGNKPMDIKWELSEPIPNYLWKASAKMAVG